MIFIKECCTMRSGANGKINISLSFGSCILFVRYSDVWKVLLIKLLLMFSMLPSRFFSKACTFLCQRLPFRALRYARLIFSVVAMSLNRFPCRLIFLLQVELSVSLLTPPVLRFVFSRKGRPIGSARSFSIPVSACDCRYSYSYSRDHYSHFDTATCNSSHSSNYCPRSAHTS